MEENKGSRMGRPNRNKLPPINVPKWDGSELCTQVPHELFFEYETRTKSGREDVQDLKKLCSNCPRLNECAEYAIKHELYGFWGGMTEQERIAYRKKFKITYIRPEIYSELLPQLQNKD